jgi:flagellar motor switch/type III secretory pathway protein FliN
MNDSMVQAISTDDKDSEVDEMDEIAEMEAEPEVRTGVKPEVEAIEDDVKASSAEEPVDEAVIDEVADAMTSEDNALPQEIVEETTIVEAEKEEMSENSAELPSEDEAFMAPEADSSRVRSAEATEIQIPEVFLHAECRKGISASVAKMPILVTFEVGKKSIRLGDLEILQEGFIFECENPIKTSVNICANGQLIGKGDLLNIEGRVGVRVMEIY